MFAVLPFVRLPVWDIPLGGTTLPLDPWATLVCLGFVLGLEVARARGIKLGLDVRDVVDGAVFIVLMGFFVGHVFTVVAYFPERLSTDGIWSILRVWEGFSSTGGFIGAVLGWLLFYGVIRKRDVLLHGDTIVFGFPLGWMFGRLGCAVVHDHVGSETSFPLAMWFPYGALRDAAQNLVGASGRGVHFDTDPHRLLGGIVTVPPSPLFGADGQVLLGSVRHELGLYEAVFTMGLTALFFALGRKERPKGFFLALFGAVYAPMRFGLDFLRNTDLSFQDARYYGLTPAQYGMIVLFAACAWGLYRVTRPVEAT